MEDQLTKEFIDNLKDETEEVINNLISHEFVNQEISETKEATEVVNNGVEERKIENHEKLYIDCIIDEEIISKENDEVNVEIQLHQPTDTNVTVDELSVQMIFSSTSELSPDANISSSKIDDLISENKEITEQIDCIECEEEMPIIKNDVDENVKISINHTLFDERLVMQDNLKHKGGVLLSNEVTPNFSKNEKGIDKIDNEIKQILNDEEQSHNIETCLAPNNKIENNDATGAENTFDGELISEQSRDTLNKGFYLDPVSEQENIPPETQVENSCKSVEDKPTELTVEYNLISETNELTKIGGLKTLEIDSNDEIIKDFESIESMLSEVITTENRQVAIELNEDNEKSKLIDPVKEVRCLDNDALNDNKVSGSSTSEEENSMCNAEHVKLEIKNFESRELMNFGDEKTLERDETTNLDGSDEMHQSVNMKKVNIDKVEAISSGQIIEETPHEQPLKDPNIEDSTKELSVSDRNEIQETTNTSDPSACKEIDIIDEIEPVRIEENENNHDLLTEKLGYVTDFKAEELLSTENINNLKTKSLILLKFEQVEKSNFVSESDDKRNYKHGSQPAGDELIFSEDSTEAEKIKNSFEHTDDKVTEIVTMEDKDEFISDAGEAGLIYPDSKEMIKLDAETGQTIQLNEDDEEVVLTGEQTVEELSKQIVNDESHKHAVDTDTIVNNSSLGPTTQSETFVLLDVNQKYSFTKEQMLEKTSPNCVDGYKEIQDNNASEIAAEHDMAIETVEGEAKVIDVHKNIEKKDLLSDEKIVNNDLEILQDLKDKLSDEIVSDVDVVQQDANSKPSLSKDNSILLTEQSRTDEVTIVSVIQETEQDVTNQLELNEIKTSEDVEQNNFVPDTTLVEDNISPDVLPEKIQESNVNLETIFYEATEVKSENHIHFKSETSIVADLEFIPESTDTLLKEDTDLQKLLYQEIMTSFDDLTEHDKTDESKDQYLIESREIPFEPKIMEKQAAKTWTENIYEFLGILKAEYSSEEFKKITELNEITGIEENFLKLKENQPKNIIENLENGTIIKENETSQVDRTISQEGDIETAEQIMNKDVYNAAYNHKISINLVDLSKNECSEICSEKVYRAVSPDEKKHKMIPSIELNFIDEIKKLGLDKQYSNSFFVNKIENNETKLIKSPTNHCKTQLSTVSNESFWIHKKNCKDMEFTVFAGSSATITIPYESESESPKITWNKIDELDGGILECMQGFEQIDGATSLIFKNVDKASHGGSYLVRLEDEFGFCSCKVHVVVKDKPGPPDSPKLALSPDDETTITLSWLSPNNDGGDKILRYMIERCDSSSNSWIFFCSVPGECLQAKIPTLLLGRSSSFRVAAENSWGLSQFSQAVPNFLLHSDFSGSTRPWFVQKLPFKMELFEGKPFALYCSNSKNMGCRPWFIKKLPDKFRVEKGEDLELQCDVDSFADNDSVDFKCDIDSLILPNGDANFENEYYSFQSTDVPCAPASLTTSLINRSTISIGWTPPRNSIVNNLLNYVVEKRDEGSNDWTFLAKLPPDVYECELGNMSSGKGYFLRVSAQNQFGVGPSRELIEPIRINIDQYRDVPEKPSTPYVIGSKASDRRWLNWETCYDQENNNNFSNILHYIVERREVISANKLKISKCVVHNPSFPLQNLKEGVEYQFRIFAVNSVGISSPSDSSTPYYFNSEDEQPARFKKKLKDAIAKEGERAQFSCLVIGSPAPKIKWFKNFCEVLDGHKHVIKITESGSSDLVINNVNESDCGEIECRASNNLGTCSTRALLTIHSSARLRLTENTIEGLQFTRGSTMKIRVPLNGRPIPDVVWMKEGQVISGSDRISFEQDDLSATMTIEDCTRSDVGVYQIMAMNYIGSDEARFSVCVTDRPNPPPGEPVITDITDTSCVLTWKACEDDGGSPIIEYIVERLDKKSGNKWKLCNSTVFNTIKMSNLKTNCTYQFRLRTKNVYGISDESLATKPATITGNANVDYDKLALTDTCGAPQSHPLDPNNLRNEISFHKKYTICEEISRGSHGVMNRIVEKETNRSFLVRFVKCSVVEKMMIRQEIEILSSLNHPNIINLHDAYEMDGEVAYVFELISGCDLLNKMVSNSKPHHSEINCINYVRQICQAVSHMHKNNVVNIDIRPDTIFFKSTASHQLKLSNFTSSQRLDPSRCVRVYLPTVSHCPPEFLTSSTVSYFTDTWNLGIIAYTILSGNEAFPGTSEEEKQKTITGPCEVNFNDELWMAISNYAQSWIRKCLNKMPDERMTIAEALSHPWLNGEAESKLSDTPLSSKHLITLNSLTQQRFNNDILSIGRLAYDGAIFLKMTRCHIALEREINMELPDLPPEVVLELSNTEVYVGGTARFKCKFHGRPEPSVKWLHDNEELDWSSGRYTPWSKGGVFTLEISDVITQDEGHYMCVASDGLGSRSTIGELSVQEFPSKKFGCRDQSRRSSQDSITSSSVPRNFDFRDSMGGDHARALPTGVNVNDPLPPSADNNAETSQPLHDKDSPTLTFTEELVEMMKCRQGEDATFKCVLSSADRVVSVVWLKDDQDVSKVRGHVIAKKLHGNVFVLILKNVSCEDEGLYKVEISNQSSTVSSIAHLFVV